MISISHQPKKISAGKIINLSFSSFSTVSKIHRNRGNEGRVRKEIAMTGSTVFVGSENVGCISKFAPHVRLIMTESTHKTDKKYSPYIFHGERKIHAQYLS